MSAQNHPQAGENPKGIEHPGVIDFLAFDAASQRVLLVMVERRPWNEPELQLFQLQEKLNAYLSFILDGEMEESYPQFARKPVLLRFECAAPPVDQVLDFLQIVHDQTALQGIDFEVEVMGGGCGCGKPGSECSSAQSSEVEPAGRRDPA
jgi:hypothetical protein